MKLKERVMDKMPAKEILLLGNPRLHQTCDGVSREDVKAIEKVVTDLHDTLMGFRKLWGAGRAIAAPQNRCYKATCLHEHPYPNRVNQSSHNK